MSRRDKRSNMVVEAFSGSDFGWSRSPHDARVCADWDRRFPNLPLVSDGVTSRGRGTTGFDLFRKVGCRSDFLSVKTDTIENKSGKLPSKLSLSTGNLETIWSLIEGINRGSSLATVVFSSYNGQDGPRSDGLALFLDLAQYIRGGVATAPKGGYRKGQAPPVYFKWSSRRKCGSKRAKLARINREYPYVDEQGRKWVSPEHVCYRELVVSLTAIGINRKSWVPCDMRDLPSMVEGQNWDRLSWGELIG